jgi:hypothetical protein
MRERGGYGRLIARFGGNRGARRLMPFRSVLARRGVLLGDSAGGGAVRVTNGKRFSYPGYNELLTGSADDRIDSNDKIPNPNVTVLEWLNRRAPFAGSVAAFGSWDVLPFILNTGRSGFRRMAGPPVTRWSLPPSEMMNALGRSATYWGTVVRCGHDAGRPYYLKTGSHGCCTRDLGDTDEWAHERRYDLYLDAIYRGRPPGALGRGAVDAGSGDGRRCSWPRTGRGSVATGPTTAGMCQRRNGSGLGMWPDSGAGPRSMVKGRAWPNLNLQPPSRAAGAGTGVPVGESKAAPSILPP